MSDNFDPIWEGTREIVEVDGSPKLKVTSLGCEFIRTYEGPIDSLRAAYPRPGTLMIDTGSCQVEDVDIQPVAGEMGRMIVTLATENTDYTIADAPEYKLRWERVQKDLLLHPRYQASGDMPLVTSDRDAITYWKNTVSPGDRATLYAEMTTQAKDFVDKLELGEDSWILYIPIISEIHTFRYYPSDAGGQAGYRESPPGPAPKPDTSTYWEWLKTAHEVERHGYKWTLTREWTGAQDIDYDIYPDSL
jgi:hypothetical protein